MKLTEPNQPWPKLAALARRAPADSRGDSAPLGFSTRVVALAFADTERRMVSLFELLAPRALWVAALLVIASVAVNFSSFGTSDLEEAAAQAVDDPVAMLFD